jgi:hypothetical protein
MRKQKSSSMKIDDDYTAATKRLIKKTLIGFGITILLVTSLGVWIFKKATDDAPNSEVASATTTASVQSVQPSASTVLFEMTSPLPTASASTAPSMSPTPEPTAQPTASVTPTNSPLPTTTNIPTPGKIISSQSNLDGYQSSNGSGSTTAEIKIGRNNTSISRGFLSFDLSQIPESSILDKATLRMYQQGIIGSPYISGTELKIDQLNYGSTFESSDYSTSSISSSFTSLSTNTSPGWRDIDVTQNIKGDKTADRPRAQFRVHFALEQLGGSSTGDYVLFESGDNTLKTGNTPQLVVLSH